MGLPSFVAILLVLPCGGPWAETHACDLRVRVDQKHVEDYFVSSVLLYPIEFNLLISLYPFPFRGRHDLLFLHRIGR